MAGRELSVFLDDDTADAARAAAEAEGLSLSDWLTRAAAHELVDDHAPPYRPIAPDVWHKADTTLGQLGLDSYSVPL